MANKYKRTLRCVAYLSCPDANMNNAELKEDKQYKEIKKYADAHQIEIIKVKRRSILGQAEANKHFSQMVMMIAEKKCDGIIAMGMKYIDPDIENQYKKAGAVHKAKGKMITVEEGYLHLPLWNGYRKDGAANVSD